MSKYQSTSGWKKFKNIVAIGSEPNKKLTITASPSGGEVSKGTVVYLTASSDGSNVSGCDIYYTLNGTTPTKSSTKYTSSGITINSNCTLKAIAYKSGYEDSEVLTATYTIKSTPKQKLTLSASPSGGQVSKGSIVTLTAKADGSIISGCDVYYTLNGTTPTKNSTKYTSSGITINSAYTLKAIAYKDGYETSDVGEWKYTIKDDIIAPTSIGVYPSSKTIKVGDTFTASYTLNPSNATTTVTWYSDNSSIASVSSSGLVTGKSAGTTYINAKTANGKEDWCKVTVEPTSKPKLVLSASPNGGTVSSGTNVYLTAKADGSTVSGCDIYYTLNGDKPSTSSTKYTSNGITITENCTLKAIAYKDGYETSDVLTEPYTIKDKTKLVVVASPSGGEVTKGTNVKLFVRDKNGNDLPGDIYYTLDGSTPSKSSTKYTSSGITIDSDCTLKAIAYKSGYEDSEILVQSYTVPKDKICDVTITYDVKFPADEQKYDMINIPLDRQASEALSHAFQMQVSNITSKMQEWNSEGPTDGKIMFYAFGADGQLENRGSTANGISHWFNAESEACSWNSGCVFSELNTNEMTFILGQKPGMCSLGSKYVIRQALLYRKSATEQARASFIFNITIDNETTFVLTDINQSNSAEEKEKLIVSASTNSGEVAKGNIVKLFVRDKNGNDLPGDIYYTLNGSTPSTSSTRYSPSGITINEACTLKAIAYMDGYQASDVLMATYTIKPDPKLELSASPSGGQVSAGTKVTLTAKVDGCSDDPAPQTSSDVQKVTVAQFNAAAESSGVWYQLTGTIKNLKNGDLYGNFDLVDETGSVYVYGLLSERGGEKKKFQELVADKGIANDKIITIIGNRGSYNGKIEVINAYFADNTVSDCDIFYTINGSSPSKSSTKYTSSGITINEACTLKAIAYKDGYETSDILTENYTIKYDDMRLSIASSGYATFFSSESAYKLPSGLSAKVVKAADNGKLTYETIIIIDGSNTNIVPKDVPVMIESNAKQAGTYTLAATESGATYTGTNLLRGSDEATTTTGDGYHYKLSYGPTGTKWDDVLGWYWGAQNGAPFQIDGHKAWLVVPRSGTRAAGFTIEGESLDIEDIDQTPLTTDCYYDLQGRRLTGMQNVRPSKKGVYIRNGQKVVVK